MSSRAQVISCSLGARWRLIPSVCCGSRQHDSGHVVGDGSYLPRLARARKVSELAQTYGLWNR